MPTILTHPAVPLALGLGLGTRVISPRLLAAGAVAAIVPDFDVIGFGLGVSYASAFGHRGATHSLAFAVLLATLVASMARALDAPRTTTFLFIAFGTASHGLLDMVTNGGLGVALFWPFSEDRLFFPAQVVQVSPIGVRRFLAGGAVAVLRSELVWIWLPSAGAWLALVALRRKNGG